MGRKRRRFFKWLSLCIGIIILAGLVQNLFCGNLDHDRRRLQGFYLEDKDSLDVVFLGGSEVFSDFSSAQAYDEYGFTSYPYAVRSNSVTLWKYELKEILKRQSPKLIVVETNGALYGDKVMLLDSNFRRVADNIPLSLNKIEMVNAFGTEGALSYYFPIIKYHDNWERWKTTLRGAKNSLAMYRQGTAYLKGASVHSGKYKVNGLIDVEGDTSETKLDPLAEKSLKEFLQYCTDNHIDNVMFVRFPHCMTEEEENYPRYQRNNAAAKIIESYGFDYLDMDHLLDEMDLKPEEDFFNGEHMNARGMKKMTAWLGKYLVDKYAIEPIPQTEKNTARWQRSAEYMRALYKYFEKLQEKYGYRDTEIYENVSLMSGLHRFLDEE